jgi:hypothetical protein
MKTAWDSYLDQQLADPTVRQAFEEETKVLDTRSSAPPIREVAGNLDQATAKD